MRGKILVIFLVVLLVSDTAFGCFCRQRGLRCNCLPRKRLNLIKRPRRIVAVIQPLPQDQIINPNICPCAQCGEVPVPMLNPLVSQPSEVVPELDQTAFGARCICSKQLPLPNIPNLFNPTKSICGCGVTTCTCIAPLQQTPTC
ncbi:hypothetical protein DMENIID0001_083610 [Sergentomyia squamirostris]